MQTRYLIFFRGLLAGTLLLYTLHAPSPPIEPVWTWLLFFAYLALASCVYWTGQTRRLPDSTLLFFFLVDMIITSSVLYINEGFHNEFYVAYFLVILSTCFLEKLSFSLIVGVGAFIIYAYFAFPESGELQPFYLLRSSLLLVTAFFSAYVADSVRRIERATTERYADEMAWMQRLSIVGKAMAAVLHEAKTPLSTITLAVEQVRELTRRGENPEDSLDMIDKEAQRTLAILTNFLDFAKPRPLELKNLDINRPIKRALEAVQLYVQDRDIALDVELGPAAKIHGSERHLVQVFTNIMLNALQAMPLGGKLRVRKTVLGGLAKVDFLDTGVGLAEDTISRLCEPFFTGKPESGHGLGLTVARWIIQKHSGELLIRSDGPGKGAVVSVSLPLLR